ncbi:MAG: hypothetical protein ABDH91_03095 [Bacteroidia bacterium]
MNLRLALAGLAGFMLWAQEASPGMVRKSRWGWQTYFEVGYNRFLGIPDTLRGSLRGAGSIKVNFATFPFLRLGAFYIGAGLGLTIREVRFAKIVRLFSTPDNKLGYLVENLPSSVRAKSKLQLGYLRVPVELGLLKGTFNFAVYGFGELLLWSKHKRKYAQNGELARFISYGNDVVHTDILQYGVGARIGYRSIGLFASYNLSPLWSGGRGPANVHPLQVGIYFFGYTIPESISTLHSTSLSASAL